MRKPRYRAWRKDTKEMHYAFDDTKSRTHFQFYEDGSWVLSKEYEENGESKEMGIVDYRDGVLMQSTGEKDKKGKEIWEGDILYSDMSVKHWTIVEYHDGEFTAEPILKRDKRVDQPAFYAKHHKVIGNIFEHPDLYEHGAKNTFVG